MSRKRRPYDPDSLPPAQRLRANLRDLYASNEISGQRAGELVADEAVARGSACGPVGRRPGKNAARDLRRRFLKFSLWPDLYLCPI